MMSIQQLQSQLRAFDATPTTTQHTLADLPAMLGAPTLPPKFWEHGNNSFFITTQHALASLRKLINRSPISFPEQTDRSQPQGSLRVDNATGTITTAGGYKIEQLGQFEWKITDPDGSSSTRIWGDPHVDESDRDGAGGVDWDFKRDSSFVLGDGTRINVSTKPWSGNPNMTVTAGLEIISGNERVVVSGIDEGKGKVGQVTQDGFANINRFANELGRAGKIVDTFVMGDNAADWTLGGKEIISSNNGGDSFNTGGNMAAGAPRRRPGDETATMRDMLATMQQMLTLMQSMLNRMEKSGDQRASFPLEQSTDARVPRYADRRFNGNQIRRDVALLTQGMGGFRQQNDLLDVIRNNRVNITINNNFAQPS